MNIECCLLLLQFLEKLAGHSLLIVKLKHAQVGQNLAHLLILIVSTADCALQIVLIKDVGVLCDCLRAITAQFLKIVVLNLLKTIFQEAIILKLLYLLLCDTTVTSRKEACLAAANVVHVFHCGMRTGLTLPDTSGGRTFVTICGTFLTTDPVLGNAELVNLNFTVSLSANTFPV